MIAFKPLKLAFWLAIGGISFGIALNLGWLTLLGLASPVFVCGGFLVASALRGD